MIEKIEQYASTNNVPIMQKEGIDFLTNFIKENNVKTILEVGSAIGYSAIKMALVDKNIKIVTVERDELRYKEALQNINEFNLNDQIEIILSDAHDVDLEENFDLIFIDAAKSSYIRFFEKFSKNLNKNGVIITDNLHFHGLLDAEIKNRNLKQLVNKIKKYIDYLENNLEFETEFHEIGDGISISKRR